MAESASNTRAVASNRSIRLVSLGPTGARSLQKKPCLRNPSGKGNNRFVVRCLGYYSYRWRRASETCRGGLPSRKPPQVT